MLFQKIISPVKMSDLAPWPGPRQLLVPQERSKVIGLKMSANSVSRDCTFG